MLSFNAFNEAIVLRQWEGADPRTSPIGIEFQATQGALFDILYRYFQFDKLVEGALTVRSQPEDATYQNDVAHVERLKKELAGGKVKITIKLEVEKINV